MRTMPGTVEQPCFRLNPHIFRIESGTGKSQVYRAEVGLSICEFLRASSAAGLELRNGVISKLLNPSTGRLSLFACSIPTERPWPI